MVRKPTSAGVDDSLGPLIRWRVEALHDPIDGATAEDARLAVDGGEAASRVHRCSLHTGLLLASGHPSFGQGFRPNVIHLYMFWKGLWQRMSGSDFQSSYQIVAELMKSGTLLCQRPPPME